MDRCPNRCGKCCTSILPLSDEEIETIHSYIKEYNIKPHNYNSPLSSSNEHKDYCPFYWTVNKNGQKENRCLIYSVRPEICEYFTCNNKLKYPPEKFNYYNKKIVNLIVEFVKDNKYTPKSAPDAEQLNIQFQEKLHKVLNTNKK